MFGGIVGLDYGYEILDVRFICVDCSKMGGEYEWLWVSVVSLVELIVVLRFF